MSICLSISSLIFLFPFSEIFFNEKHIFFRTSTQENELILQGFLQAQVLLKTAKLFKTKKYVIQENFPQLWMAELIKACNSWITLACPYISHLLDCKFFGISSIVYFFCSHPMDSFTHLTGDLPLWYLSIGATYVYCYIRFSVLVKLRNHYDVVPFCRFCCQLKLIRGSMFVWQATDQSELD